MVLSQVKINVTNAYSGSLSWSNFFSRILHWHPGRVVWLFLNVGIALLLMEFGVFGPVAQAFSPFLAILIAFILSPVIAILTKGKYYIARPNTLEHTPETKELRVLNCTVCTQDYEALDMAYCPFHQGTICSLCCTLEKNCHDMCKHEAVVQEA